MKIAVLGAGAWGTALAATFSARHGVTLWGRDESQLGEIARLRRNDRYLPGIALPETLRIEPRFADALRSADLALIATSTSGLRDTADQTHQLHPDLPIVWVCKGFDKTTGQLPHETVAAIAGRTARYGALSGPSFAQEVAKGLPCALTLAMNDFALAQNFAAALSGGALRVYSNADLVGVELGGALKNVMAIAAGLSDGMQLGLNARAALITRGLAEMVRLGLAMGGKAETFMGLTGLGDLVLTTTGDLSRNRTVGIELARGRSLADILAALGHVAEGVNSAQTTLALAKKHAVEMPITAAVCAVLFDAADPKETVKQLLSRETRAE